MRMFLSAVCLAAVIVPAQAAELTLNDLPTVLRTLRGCQDGLFTSSCQLSDRGAWASVHESGRITIFYDNDNGLKTNGSGSNLSNALRDLASNLNKTRDGAKKVLDAMAPLLPTQ